MPDRVENFAGTSRRFAFLIALKSEFFARLCIDPELFIPAAPDFRAPLFPAPHAIFAFSGNALHVFIARYFINTLRGALPLGAAFYFFINRTSSKPLLGYASPQELTLPHVRSSSNETPLSLFTVSAENPTGESSPPAANGKLKRIPPARKQYCINSKCFAAHMACHAPGKNFRKNSTKFFSSAKISRYLPRICSSPRVPAPH